LGLEWGHEKQQNVETSGAAKGKKKRPLFYNEPMLPVWEVGWL
jgi:hypothetical protein